jgi:MFS transporter, ACDE family, multidrug resistance protein
MTTVSSGESGGLLRQPKAVWAVAFACVIAFMGIGLVDPILPAIATDLHASPSQVELLFTSYFAITGVSMLVTGVVSSRFGAKRTLLAGLALIVTFSALAGASGSVGAIVGFRAGWGLGNALFIATALAVIVGAASGGVAGAIILYEAALGLGIATGPLLGGLLGGISWRGPFFGTAVLMSIGFVAVLALLPRSPRPDHHTSLADPIRALRHRSLLTIGLTALFYNFGFFTLLGYAPFPLGLGVHGLGLVFFGWGLVLAVTSVFLAPRLQRRFGTVRTLYVVLGFFAADLLAMGLFTDSQLALILAVISAGAFLGVNNTLVTETVMKVSPVERPVASAGYSFIRFSGGAIAPYLAGKLAEWFSPHVPFFVGAGAVVIGMLVLASGHALFGSLDTPSRTLRVVGELPPNQPVILLAVDAGPDGPGATETAAEIAGQHGAAVEVLHVRETDVVNDDAVDRESVADADRVLDERIRQLADHGIPVAGRIVQTTGGAADPAAAIVRRATDARAELVVLVAPHADPGRFGRATIRRVQQACSSPVLVIDPERARYPSQRVDS